MIEPTFSTEEAEPIIGAPRSTIIQWHGRGLIRPAKHLPGCKGGCSWSAKTCLALAVGRTLRRKLKCNLESAGDVIEYLLNMPVEVLRRHFAAGRVAVRIVGERAEPKLVTIEEARHVQATPTAEGAVQAAGVDVALMYSRILAIANARDARRESMTAKAV